MRVSVIVEELKNGTEWERFLQTCPGSTFYHSLKWKDVIRRSFPHSALYLTIKDKDGKLIGICPGFIVGSMGIKIYHSLPFSDYGGPLIERQCAMQASLSLRSFLHSVGTEMDITYAKFCFTASKFVRFFEDPLGCVERAKGIVEIDLKATPSSFVWNTVFSQNRRKKIKRIERDGFQAREASTKSDLKEFYDLYYKNMKYIGASPYPYEFLENIWYSLYPENLRIWLVGNDKRISGNLYLKDEQRSYAVYAGIDRELAGTKSVVNYVRWKEIKKAEEEGLSYVSFGSTPSDPRDSYYLQKMSLGGSFYQQEIVWYPLSSAGSVLLQTRAKTVSTWKAIRHFLPTGFKRILEEKLLTF